MRGRSAQPGGRRVPEESGKQVEAGVMEVGEGGGRRRDYPPSTCWISGTSRAAFTAPWERRKDRKPVRSQELEVDTFHSL